MLVDNIEKKLEITIEIIKDPELFLRNRYYAREVPKGFRIELFIARKFKLICDNLKQFNLSNLNVEDRIPVKKLRDIIANRSLPKHPKKFFCPYCEKLVIPKRFHKLDFADIVLGLLTAGIWAIFLFAMYLFIRRCPACNYNLRGFKPLSERKEQSNR